MSLSLIFQKKTMKTFVDFIIQGELNEKLKSVFFLSQKSKHPESTSFPQNEVPEKYLAKT